jgi:general secretion pathway protein N
MGAARIAVLAAFALIAGIGVSGAQGTRPPRPAAAAPPAAEDTESAVPPLDELSATRDRPLFSSTRRPPAVAAAPEQAPVTEGRSMPFELVGIVSGADASFAILRNTESKEETRVAKGQKIGNWTIEEIADRAIILSGDSKRVRMRLFNESKAPGIKVEQVGGERASAPEDADADDDEKVDEEVEPSSSPEARPAAAPPQPPNVRRDRRARQNPGSVRNRPRPPRQNSGDDDE